LSIIFNNLPLTTGVRSRRLIWTKTVFWPGLCPGHRWEGLRRSPRARSRLGRGTPSPYSHLPRRIRPLDLGVFGASLLTPPPIQIPTGVWANFFLVGRGLSHIYRKNFSTERENLRC